MGRLFYLIIICPLAQKMIKKKTKCIVLIFTDSLSDSTNLREIIGDADIIGAEICVDESDEHVSCLIDIKNNPILREAYSV